MDVEEQLKKCNRLVLQPKVQEVFMLPLDVEFHNL